jgi:hypothetical protein
VRSSFDLVTRTVSSSLNAAATLARHPSRLPPTVAEALGTAIGAVLEHTDLNRVLDRVDLDRVLARLDVGAVLDRVDLDAILAKVDLNALLSRLDVNSVLEEVDVGALVENTDLGAVIAHSTGGVASSAVDLVRRQGVGLDGVVAGLARRVRRRALADAPTGPPGLSVRLATP